MEKQSYFLKSGVAISTDFQVEKELVQGNLHILLLMESGKIPDNNIICFDSSGSMIWLVEPYSFPTGEENPYMNIKANDDKTFVGSTWKGLEAKIDLSTGKILEKIKRRPW